MNTITTWLPYLTSLIVLVFAVLVFRRYVSRRGIHLLIWGLGLILYGIASFCAAYYTALGWNSLIYRLWYLCGAILSAAWLGQGTVYLLARRRWADALMVILGLGSLYGLIRVFGAQLDPSLLTGGKLSSDAITSGGVRILTPFFNIYGTVTLVGGAAYSAWIFWRKRVLPHRVIGNVLIAVGAMAPALGGSLSRLGLGGYLYLSELVGAVLMFIGFIRATSPMKKK
ncbi:MAG: hypothetical protein ACE5I2_07245 [Anaerolineae bacterium]